MLDSILTYICGTLLIILIGLGFTIHFKNNTIATLRTDNTDLTNRLDTQNKGLKATVDAAASSLRLADKAVAAARKAALAERARVAAITGRPVQTDPALACEAAGTMIEEFAQ